MRKQTIHPDSSSCHGKPPWVLGIPYVNRADLLRKAVYSVSTLWPGTVIFDNSPEGKIITDAVPWPVKVIRPSVVSLTLAQTIGALFHEAKRAEAEVALFMHNDAEAEPGTAEKLVEMVGSLLRRKVKWGAVFTHYDTLIAFNMKAVAAIGS